MKVEIERRKINGENSEFVITKSPDMTLLEVIGVLEIAKREILDSMTKQEDMK